MLTCGVVEKLSSTLTQNIGLPKINGLEPPAGTLAYFVVDTTPDVAAAKPAVADGPWSGAGVAYAINAADHVKYHQLFVQYDVDKDMYGPVMLCLVRRLQMDLSAGFSLMTRQ